MRLQEYQSKALLRQYGVSTPRGKVITAIEPDQKKIAKAQVLMGKRMKQGLIRSATRENLTFLFRHCDEVLLEERLKIEKEYYLSLLVDPDHKEIRVLFSDEGGIEVETAKKMVCVPLTDLCKLPQEILPLVNKIKRLMIDYQALLVEINPLALVKGKLIAADAKIVLDDNCPRLPFPAKRPLLEEQAFKQGISYVELKGDIGVIGNGAGLVMATLDIIDYFGGQAANFLDLGGGAAMAKMTTALKLVSARQPQVILVNVFGGITRGDEIAKGIVAFLKQNRSRIPLVVRIAGTKKRLARKILCREKIASFSSLEESVKKAVKLCQS